MTLEHRIPPPIVAACTAAFMLAAAWIVPALQAATASGVKVAPR